jgi:hypothetical protein
MRLIALESTMAINKQSQPPFRSQDGGRESEVAKIHGFPIGNCRHKIGQLQERVTRPFLNGFRPNKVQSRQQDVKCVKLEQNSNTDSEHAECHINVCSIKAPVMCNANEYRVVWYCYSKAICRCL